MRVLRQLQSRFGLPVTAPRLVTTASAAQLEVASIPVSAAIPAGTANYLANVRGKNNTANCRLLDYALAVITLGGPAPGDFTPVPVLRSFSDLIGYLSGLGVK